jgi:UPF0176 protein
LDYLVVLDRKTAQKLAKTTVFCVLRRMDNSMVNMPITVVALYRFARFARFNDFQDPLVALCKGLGIKGTLLLAHEGINGTVAGSREAIAELLVFLEAIPEISGMEIKYSYALVMPFNRMKVRLKKEIVTMGEAEIDPLLTVGTYVAPKDWNALISDPDTVVIDTRNDYETRVGTFAGAIDPNTKEFNEFPQWLRDHKDEFAGKKVAMYCTGGIRCEKATALAKEIGLDEVYHLKGGILGYLEQVPAENSRWEGECFVFDERVTVGHGLALGDTILCRACREPVTVSERQDEKFVEGLSCPHCYDRQTAEDRARFAERQKQILLAKKRGEKHLGDDAATKLRHG